MVGFRLNAVKVILVNLRYTNFAAHLLVDDGVCVSDCGPGRMADSRRCIDCGGTCRKSKWWPAQVTQA